MTFRKYMQNVEDSRLLKAFEELQECSDTGILTDGETRQLQRKYEEIYDARFPIKDIEREIYYEMAMRYYEIKNS